MFYIEFSISAVRAWYCAIAHFPKALVGKMRVFLSVLSLVYHTLIQVDPH